MLSLALITACKKEHLNIESKTSEAISISNKDETTEDRIISFKNKVKQFDVNKANNSIDYILLEDAIWDIEAMLNYDHADAGRSFDEIEHHTRTINFALKNDKITEKDLIKLYNLIGIEYRNIINDQKFQSKDGHIVYIDIHKNEENMAKNKNVNYINITIARGLTVTNEKKLVRRVNETDYWHPVGPGKCGPYEGQNTNQYGCDRLEQLVTRRIDLPQGCHYTNIITVDYSTLSQYDIYISNPNDNIPNDNNRDYLLFAMNKNFPNYNGWYCMSPDDMRFYRDGINMLIDNTLDMFPNHKLLSCDIDWLALACGTNWHTAQIRMGELHCDRING